MKYNINKNNLPNILDNIKKEILENHIEIDELLKLDYKYCKFKIDLKTLEIIVDKLKNEMLNTEEEQTIIVNYNGNPYLTLNLSILAILTKTTLILDFDENMLGTNNFIIEIINNILKNFETDRLIFNLNKIDKERQNVDKIICIDDINKYNTYLCEKRENVKFYRHNYIDFYCNSDKFDDITDLIYKYAENNMIPIESYSELDLNEAVKMIKNGLGKMIILLTDDEETKEVFENNIKDKKIYTNTNPFSQDIKIINREIFNI